MPTASQVLLTKRSSSSPRIAPPLTARSQTMPSDMTASGSVNKLTVQFPRVYLDQRHGHSLLRGEYGDYIADTAQMDRIIKEYMKTGNRKLEMPFEKQDTTPVIRMVVQGGSIPARQLPTKLSAAEFLPMKRRESIKYERSHSDSNLGDYRPVSTASDYIEAEDVLHRGKSYPSNVATPGYGLSNSEYEDVEEDSNYVYFQLGPFSDESEGSEVEDGWPKIDEEIDSTTRPSAIKTERSKTISNNVVRLRRVEIETDDDDNGIKEVFVDDSNPEKIHIYQIEDGKSLVKVKHVEIRTATDGSNVLIDTPVTCDDHVDVDSDTGDVSNIVFSNIIPSSQGKRQSNEVNNKTVKITKATNQKARDNDNSLTTFTDIKDLKGFEPLSARRNSGPKSEISKLISSKNQSPRDPNISLKDGKGLLQPKGFLPSVSVNIGSTEENEGSLSRTYNTLTDSKDVYASLGLNYTARQKPTENSGADSYNRETSDLYPQQPYVSQEPTFLSTEETESGDYNESSGLSRLQQLSVEKKLKYLEPPVFFYDNPESRPLAVCFDYTGTSITHLTIIKGVMETLENIPNAMVTSLQFVARNVILGTMWVDNRWIIELSTNQCVTVLLGRGFTLNREPIKVRKYDDIIKEDYTKFLQNKDKFNKKGKKAKQYTASQINPMNLLSQTNGTESFVNELLGGQLEAAG